MTDAEIIRKADAGFGLTVPEIKRYEQLVKLVEHVYGKYGTLAKIYLHEQNSGKEWCIENLPEYLHGVDKAANKLWDTMYLKLKKAPQYQKTGNFMHNMQIETEIHRLIDEEILSEIVYVD